MLKWFKRVAKPVPKPSSIAPLYVASTDQIQGTINAVNELNSRLDNLPPIPDMTAYANKNEENTFTQKQTFNRGMYLNNQKIEGLAAPVGNGDATHKQYVDSADSSKLREAKIYADTQDTAKLQEAKTYTDTQIAAIPAPDLSNVAKLDTQNTFQKSIKVKQGINVEGYLWADDTQFNSGTIENVPNKPKSIVNKEYVDNIVNGVVRYTYNETRKYCSVWTKQDINSNLWYYQFGNISWRLTIPEKARNKYVLIFPYIRQVYPDNNSNNPKTIAINFPPIMEATSGETLDIIIEAGTPLVHHYDWKRGVWNGSQSIMFDIKCEMIVLESVI